MSEERKVFHMETNFNEIKLCPKCGSDVLRRTYEPEIVFDDSIRSEALSVTCAFCGYHIGYEDCADFVPAETEAENDYRKL